MSRWLLLLSVFTITNCSSFSLRSPSSVRSETLQQSLQTQIEYLKGASYSAQSCGSSLQELKRLLKIDWSTYSNEELKTQAAKNMNLFWQLRLALHQRLPDIGTDCTLQVRDLFHQIRDQEDYMGEFAFNVEALDPSKLKFQEQAVPIYDRAAYPPYFVRSDANDPKFQFKSGDIMLARGVSFFSAIISQISTNKSHFSHVVFTHVDGDKVGTVESYIGEGVSAYEINYALKNENSRLLLLRPKDAELGKKADAFATLSAKNRVPYDYAMDFQDPKAMSCLEVAADAYKQASKGQVKAPLYPAKLALDNPRFLSQLGLKPGLLPTPDDLETDPRFDLVLDWRDYRIIRDSRQKDAVLSEMVRWLGDLHYQFHETPSSFFAKYVILPSRSTPVWPLMRAIPGVPKTLDPKIPRKTFGVMAQLNQVAGDLLEKLKAEDEKFFATNGRPMTNQQLRDTMESIRLQDLENYKNRKPAFHHVLRGN